MLPVVTKNLIIINLIIWVFMFFFKGVGATLMKYGALHYYEAPSFNAFQFVSYMFMHDTRGLAHILFNMFALFMFGNMAERVLGSGRFLFYYLTCGIGAGLIQEFAWSLSIDSLLAGLYGVDSSQIPELIARGRLSDLPIAYNMLQTVGASGAIYGVLLCFGMLFPNMRMSIMFLPVFVKAKWVVIGYGVIELLIGLSNANDGVAHFAHLGGMIFGLLMMLYWKKKGVVNGPYY